MFAQEHREAWRCSLSRVLLFAISVSSKTQSVALFWFPFPLGPLLLPQSLYIYINIYTTTYKYIYTRSSRRSIQARIDTFSGLFRGVVGQSGSVVTCSSRAGRGDKRTPETRGIEPLLVRVGNIRQDDDKYVDLLDAQLQPYKIASLNPHGCTLIRLWGCAPIAQSTWRWFQIKIVSTEEEKKTPTLREKTKMIISCLKLEEVSQIDKQLQRSFPCYTSSTVRHFGWRNVFSANIEKGGERKKKKTEKEY